MKTNDEMFWEVLASVIGALGGWEAVKYIINRSTNKRIAESEADSVEFGVLKETIMFLQEQLSEKVRLDAEKEKRFTEQTDRLRKVQDDNYDLMKEKSRIELELQRYKCIRAKCRDRQPQNGY